MILTQDGYNTLQKEYNYLTKVRRLELREMLKYASELGDLRENAEFDAAVQEFNDVEIKIHKLEVIFKTAKISDGKDLSVIGVGNSIKLLIDGDEEEYKIVGPAEVDPMNNIISYESPIGSSLMGLKINDCTEVLVNDNVIKIKVLAIN